MSNSAAALARIRLAKDWQAAYEAANGKEAPTIFWTNGRFRIDTARYSRAQVAQMVDTLKLRATQQIER